VIGRLIFLLVLIFFGCQRQRQVSIDELKAYASNSESGLLKSATMGDIKIELVYRPKELILIQEAAPGTTEWSTLLTRLDSLDYFVLRLSRNGKEIEENYNKNVERFERIMTYLGEGISGDIVLLSGEERIEPEQLLYVPSFGSSDATSILIVFKSYLSKRDGKFKVIFNGTALRMGSHEFEYAIRSIKALPSLETTGS